MDKENIVNGVSVEDHVEASTSKGRTTSRRNAKSKKVVVKPKQKQQDDDGLVEMRAIFDACQRSGSSHKEALQRLCGLKESMDAESFQDEFMKMVTRILMIWKRELAVERLVSFIGLCCTENAKTKMEANIGNEFVQELLGHLLSVCEATEKAVRLRSIQIIQTILNVVPDDGEFLSDSIWNTLEKKMISRLDDKVAAVRSQAVNALERLQDPELCNVGKDPICNRFIELLTTDSSAEVRKAVLCSIVITKATLEHVVARTRDGKDDVRACAFLQIGKRVHIKNLSISQRTKLLNDGLKDRSAKVNQACERMLCERWVGSLHGNPIDLLGFLDVEADLDTSLLALRTIFKVHYDGSMGQHQQKHNGEQLSHYLERAANWDFEAPETALTPEGSVYWFARTEALLKNGDEDKIEELIPDMTSLCKVIEVCFEQLCNPSDDDKKGKEEETQFVLRQLLQIAGMLDSRHDYVGQQNLNSMVIKLLNAKIVTSTEVHGACFNIMRSSYNHGEEESFIRQGVGLIIDFLEPLDEVDQTEDAKIQQELYDEMDLLQEELQKKVEQEDYEAAAEIKRTMKALQQKLESLPCVFENWRISRSLSLTQSLFESIRRPVLIAELPGLFDRVIITNLKQNESVERRHAALRCLGLYAQLDPKLSNENLSIFMMFLKNKQESVEVRTDALRIIFDVVMLWGLDAVVNGPANNEEEQDENDKQNKLDDLMFTLLEYMDSEEQLLRLTAAEGFAKLSVVGRLVDVRILQCLLVLYFHPSSEQDVRIRQCLAVCFPILAENTQSGRKAIEEMAAPLLQTLVAPPCDSPLLELPLETVLQYVVYLLSFSNVNVQVEFAAKILTEIGAVASSDSTTSNVKTIRSLTKALNGLTKLTEATQEQKSILEALSAHVGEEVSDATALRQFKKWNEAIKPTRPTEVDLSTYTTEINHRQDEMKSILQQAKPSTTKTRRVKATTKTTTTKKKPQRKLKSKQSLDSWSSHSDDDDEDEQPPQNLASSDSDSDGN